MLDQMLKNGLEDARVFIMGFAGLPMNPSLEDINWEKIPYSFLPAHMNTHIFNEGLVHYYSKMRPSVSFFGLCPGLVLSDGLRGHVGSSLAKLLAKVFLDQDEYATTVLVPLFGSPDIKSGALFNQRGRELKPGPWFASNPEQRAGEIVHNISTMLTRLGLQ